MKKINIWSVLFAIFINVVLLIAVYNIDTGYQIKEVKKNRIANINFDSRSKDPQLQSIKSYSEQTSAQINDISIQFKVKIKNTASVGDIFQTAPMDRGIRVELENGALNLFINTSANFPRKFALINVVQPNIDYLIAISVDNKNKLKIMIDSGSGEITDNYLRFEISDIVIGTGYSKSRPFDGVISDFSMEYSLYNMVVPGFYSIIRFLLLVSMAALFCLLFYSYDRTPEFLTREMKITLASAIILIGFILAVFYHYFLGAYLNKPYPYNTFLFGANDRFNDFFNMLNITKDLNPYFCKYFFTSNYYPFTNIIFYFFSITDKWVSLSLFSLVFVISFILLNKYYLTTASKSNLVNMLIFTFISFPFLFVIDRGNIESWVFICTALFIYYFQKNKGIPACIFLSMAIAMKLFPAIFLILMVTEKKYKELAITIALALLISIISLLLFENGFSNNLKFVLSGFDMGNFKYIQGDNNLLQRGISLFTLIKYILIKTNLINSVKISFVMSMYVKITIIVFGLIVAYIYFIEKTFWKKVTMIILPMLLFPHVSADYKLLYIFILLYLFVNNEKKTRADLFYLLMLAFLLIPKDYYYFYNVPDFSINNIINISILIIMMMVIIATGLKRTSRKNEKPVLLVVKQKNVKH